MWENTQYGGNISNFLQKQLKSGVTKLFSTNGAFAALKNDGKILTWGIGFLGGNSNEVQEDLKNVVNIVSNQKAFCAELENGQQIYWGDPVYVQILKNNFKEKFASGYV